MKELVSFKVKDIVYIAIFTAFLCAISGFSIPIGPISITLATFGVYLIGAIFPLKIAFFCVLNYILLGIMGLPVFSNFNSGIGVIAGPTGGYILGYIPLLIIENLLIKLSKEKNYMYPLSMILGTIILYLMGTIYFYCISTKGYSFYEIMKICVFPFIAVDLVKIIAACMISNRIKPIFEKHYNK